ncbi:IS66 family transposase [Massilia sp. W12]|uniref:IS66 family transposase n=1 Tax=Massilia sp. W12 TaxID=3126507 RepID=UPI0030CDC621
MDFIAQKHRLQHTEGIPSPLREELLAIIEQATQAEQKAAAFAQRATHAEQQAAQVQSYADQLRQQKEKLHQEVTYLRRMRYGIKSERMVDSTQRDLFEQDLDADIEALQAELDKLAATSPKNEAVKQKRPGRLPLAAHLLREDVLHEPASCDCPECGKAMRKVGEDVTEKLSVQPAVFSVKRHRYPKYACQACQSIHQAPSAPSIIDGGGVEHDVLAWLLVSKYLDHLPLYRLEQIGERHNVPLSRTKLAQWVGRTGVALAPLADRLAQLLRQRRCLHADETPVAQLAPKTGKTERGYQWVYRSNDMEPGPRIVVYDYQPSRQGQHARNMLAGWSGYLMADAYSGYQALFAGGVVELGCMAHARRKFFDLHAARPTPITTEALHRFAQLYEIEREAKDMCVEQRADLRREKSLPLLAEFETWLNETSARASPSSGLQKAIVYTLSRWPARVRYAHSGDLPIDNNAAENTLRPVAIGRKNWLFYGTERAGHRASCIMSLLTTAKLNGLDPYEWLLDTLNKLPTWPANRLDELLPLGSVIHV